MKFITTDRLIIRRFTPDDWKDLYEYLSNEKVVFYEPYDVFSEDACKKEAIERAKDEAFWAVCLKNNKVIGNLYLAKQDFDTWELGYVFNEKYHNKGYATESGKAIIDFAFNELKARRIVAMCNPLNSSSWKLLERLNMRREGHLLQNIYFKKDENNRPIWVDTYEYAILFDEWFGNN
ncbi:GNAT family N-acetyltransferase [Anaerocolumna xylanovorans]|uniref:Protein N-acetyltransferase, RimJ/RimL family n=1 Tax=Anaerocolumna xylanovorans DSM 12503 TaxID=1121345 RepID=A0A1M7YGT9_9FIRM|nr:GNAT family N-acetyltransferase [Anaerocolumna xylanovorans]SHO51738.1 Protein N-acetyltransferase, RimJ/RimL family [Anaerocolumna xylanovorans DSM 12503]